MEIPYRAKDKYWKWWDWLAQELLSLCIEYNIDPNEMYIKEKYGRFDINPNHGWPSMFMNKVSELEHRSYYICDVCWKKWLLRDDLWWVRTLCSKHYKEVLSNKKNICQNL